MVVAGFLNVFVRNADIVKMANMAQLVNVIAPIFTNETGLFKQTIYYPLQLFANHVKGTSLDVFVDCDTYDPHEFNVGPGEVTTQQKQVPYLDVTATNNADEVIICVVNRHKDQSISTDIMLQEGEFTGTMKVYEVNGPDVKSMNDFNNELVRTIEKPEVKAKGEKVNYSFSPHSFTLLKCSLKK